MEQASLVILCVIFVVIFMWNRQNDRSERDDLKNRPAARQKLQDTLTRLGFNVSTDRSQTTTNASGIYRGRPFQMTLVEYTGEGSRSGDARATKIHIELHQPTAGLLTMGTPAWHIDRLDRLVGRPTEKSGHRNIDEWYRFKSDPKDFAFRVFASNDLRKRLLELGPYIDNPPLWIHLEIKVAGSAIEAKVECGVHRLQILCDLLSDVADAFER